MPASYLEPFPKSECQCRNPVRLHQLTAFSASVMLNIKGQNFVSADEVNLPSLRGGGMHFKADESGKFVH